MFTARITVHVLYKNGLIGILLYSSCGPAYAITAKKQWEVYRILWTIEHSCLVIISMV